LPKYAHVPFVAEPGSKNKLSKRKIPQYLKNPDFKQVYEHGKSIADRMNLTVSAETFNPVIVDFYRQVGYLPEAIVNYLLLLGWSLDDKTEFFTRDEMIGSFSLERVNQSSASFDPKKLLAFQERYMNDKPMHEKAALVDPYLRSVVPPSEREGALVQEKLLAVLKAAGDRIKVAGDILDYAFIFQTDDSIALDEAAFEKRIRKPKEAPDLLRNFSGEITAIEPFAAATIEAALGEFLAREQIAANQIVHALRVAVTGKAVGFGLFETMELLGKETCQKRIDRTLRRAASCQDGPKTP
jgi:glutamyl-tRNA synthetase